ncbi:MAG: peptidase C11 [Lachnospiraceae bacterium]|nr:peptidase C11 [Lachnospiraceae bacterium]
MATTPGGRKKKISGQAGDVNRREEGLGTGPVGSSGGYSGRPKKSEEKDGEKGLLTDLFLGAVNTNPSQSGNSGNLGNLGGLFGGSGSSGSSQSSGSSGGLFKGKGLLVLVLLAVLIFGGGGASGLLGNLFGGASPTQGNQGNNNIIVTPPTQQPAPVSQGGTLFDSLGISGLFGGNSGSSYSFDGSATSAGWGLTPNTSKLNTSVAPGSRAKRTTIMGNKRDVVTLMVYMCGTDLESQHGMATSDLKEMINAGELSSNINLIVMTGGCKQWRVNGISNRYNQIWQVKNGQLHQLVENAGSGAMTDPNTLSGFIQYCLSNFPANRNMIVFWDHGGGTISGYGYDERSGGHSSMNLAGIQKALRNGLQGKFFDMIGFDTCLMATAENALMLSEFGDYMVASEETEPGIGWFYTNWLKKLSQNTSLSTLEIGKQISDDFVETCARQCAGQLATLSVVDLAELEKTLPAELKDFASATSTRISSDYKTVSKARSATREFAASTRIDQVDLVDMARRIGGKESDELVSVLLSAVKYNRTSTNMSNAYGLSMYFPYQQVRKVNSAIQAYKDIGMDEEYLRCIRDFASVETGGQAATGGASSGLSSLLSGYTSAGQTASSQGMVNSILEGLLGGNFNGVSGLSGDLGSFLGGSFGKSLNLEDTAQYIWENRLDPDNLKWVLYENGKYGIHLKDERWALVENLELNVFLDDGKGYIDLGLDNSFEINEYGVLIGEYDNSWIAINGQIVPYYYMSTLEEGDKYTITGRVPVLLNNQRAELILVFDNAHEDGYVAGCRYVYVNGETETVAKAAAAQGEIESTSITVDGVEETVEVGFEGISEGDVIDFVCDYYDYNTVYQDSYKLGKQITVGAEGLKVSTMLLSDRDQKAAQPVYRFTDIYQQQYWSPIIPK